MQTSRRSGHLQRWKQTTLLRGAKAERQQRQTVRCCARRTTAQKGIAKAALALARSVANTTEIANQVINDFEELNWLRWAAIGPQCATN